MKALLCIASGGLAALLIIAAPAAAQEAAERSQPPAEPEPAEQSEEPLIRGGNLPPAARETQEPQARPEPGEPVPVQQRDTPAPPAEAAPPPPPAGSTAPPPAPDATLPDTLAPTDPIPAADAPPAGSADAANLVIEEDRRHTQESSVPGWLWLLGGVLLTLGALAALRLVTGPRRAQPVVVQQHHSIMPPARAAAVAAPAVQARPWVEVSLRPFRAGVEGEAAVVEFELAVDNQGAAPARDVRVSTWLLPAGADRHIEMERLATEGPAASTLPGVSLDPGEIRRIATALALPTAQVGADAVLPVVVADARYTLPDGSEGRTAVSFAVGVRDGEELAHFATDAPSGLHGQIEARPLGEPHRR